MKLVSRIIDALPIGDGRRPFWAGILAAIAQGRYSAVFSKLSNNSGDIDYEEQVFAVCASTLVKPFDGNVYQTAQALIRADDPYPARVEIKLTYHASVYIGKGRDYGMAVQDLLLQLNADGDAVTGYMEFYRALWVLSQGKKHCEIGSMAFVVTGESAAH